MALGSELQTYLIQTSIAANVVEGAGDVIGGAGDMIGGAGGAAYDVIGGVAGGVFGAVFGTEEQGNPTTPGGVLGR